MLMILLLICDDLQIIVGCKRREREKTKEE
jgi:hypothetical protein